MGKRHKKHDPESLAELAFQRLNISRYLWKLEILLYSDNVMLRMIARDNFEYVDASVNYRSRADLEKKFLDMVSKALAELKLRTEGS